MVAGGTNHRGGAETRRQNQQKVEHPLGWLFNALSLLVSDLLSSRLRLSFGGGTFRNDFALFDPSLNMSGGLWRHSFIRSFPISLVIQV